jgi:hypothetical protein
MPTEQAKYKINRILILIWEEWEEKHSMLASMQKKNNR